MHYIIAKQKFVWHGEELDYYYANSDGSGLAVTLGIYDSAGTLKTSFEETADANGVITGSVPITTALPYSATPYYIGTSTVTDSFHIDYRGQLINQGLSYMIDSFQNIPVYNEPAEIVSPESGISEATFAFKNWAWGKQSDMLFRMENEDIKLFEDVYPDFREGRLRILNEEFAAGYDITATYKFSFFDEEMIGAAMQVGLGFINSYPPVTHYDFSNMPDTFDAYLTMFAYRECLKRLLLDIEFWNNRLIFPEVSGLRGTINSLLATANTELTELQRRAKYRGLLKPLGLSSHKISGQRPVMDGVNFRMYVLPGIAYSNM